jgi:nucleoside-diphosphate-sugar epimerase
MILVTGATGFIGRHLVKDLLEKGHSLALLTRKPELARQLFPKARAVKGDIQSIPEEACRGVSKVIHLAGAISYSLPREQLFRVNVEGTRNLLAAARNCEKLIFSSSVSVYGETNELVDEATPPTPQSPYGESKLAAERAIEAAELPSLIYRLSVVFGEGSPIWAGIMKFFGKGFPIPKARTSTNLVHVSDVSRAFQLGLKKGRGTYIIAGDKTIPFMELASLLAYHLGTKPKFWPPWVVKLLARVKGKAAGIDSFTQNRFYSIEKARRELGWQPEAYFEKEIKNMVEWYMSSQQEEHELKL